MHGLKRTNYAGALLPWHAYPGVIERSFLSSGRLLLSSLELRKRFWLQTSLLEKGVVFFSRHPEEKPRMTTFPGAGSDRSRTLPKP